MQKENVKAHTSRRAVIPVRTGPRMGVAGETCDVSLIARTFIRSLSVFCLGVSTFGPCSSLTGTRI